MWDVWNGRKEAINENERHSCTADGLRIDCTKKFKLKGMTVQNDCCKNVSNDEISNMKFTAQWRSKHFTKLSATFPLATFSDEYSQCTEEDDERHSMRSLFSRFPDQHELRHTSFTTADHLKWSWTAGCQKNQVISRSRESGLRYIYACNIMLIVAKADFSEHTASKTLLGVFKQCIVRNKKKRPKRSSAFQNRPRVGIESFMVMFEKSVLQGAENIVWYSGRFLDSRAALQRPLKIT